MTTDGNVTATALAALDLPPGRHPGDLPAELGHPGADPAPVGLDLGLAGAAAPDPATAGDPATRLPGHRLAPAAEPGQQVRELRELDLGLALPAPGVLGEDVEDQRGAVDDLDLDDALERAQLAGRELAVADHGVGTGRHDVGQFGGLARADVGRRVGRLRRWIRPSSTSEPAVSARRLSSPERVLRLARLPSAHTPISTTCSRRSGAVFDLGDVLELGRQAGYPAQRLTIFQVEFTGGGGRLV